MKNTMFIGEYASGKSDLIRYLSGDPTYRPKSALAVTYFGPYVDTPSEFLENRRYNRRLISTSNENEILVFVHSATSVACQLRPGFATMFNRRVIGVVTGIDKPGANIDRARRFLRYAGAENIFEVSVATGEGMEALRAELEAKRPAGAPVEPEGTQDAAPAKNSIITNGCETGSAGHTSRFRYP